MRLEDGTPTNAVHGFMNMFLSFYEKTQPDAIICAFDAGIPQFRLQAVEQYKAQRKPMDNELRVQFPIIEEVLKSMDIPVVKVEGWEGDDVLGTIANMCEQKNMNSLLVTGDKDVNQLASNLTKIVNMKKGVSNVAVLGPDEVFEKYGVRVNQFIDYLALMGDSSDNIPGVPGIGPKSATKLLSDFDSLEGIYENLDKLKGKQLENIKNNKDAAYVSRLAATISKDVPLDVDLDNIYFPSFDKSKTTNTFLKYRLKKNLKGVLSLIGESLEEDNTSNNNSQSEGFRGTTNINQAQQSSKINNNDKTFIQEPKLYYEDYVIDKQAKNFAKKLIENNNKFAISFGKKMPKEPVQTSLLDMGFLGDKNQVNAKDENNSKFETYVLAISDNSTTAILEGKDAVDVLKDFVINSSNNQLIIENSKDILKLLYPQNNNFKTLISADELFNADIFDISLAAYVLNSSKSDYGALDIYTQIFNTVLPAIDTDADTKKNKKDNKYIEQKNKNLKLRLARRAAVSYELYDIVLNLLKKDNAEDVFYKIEKPLTPVLLLMERNGTKIDNAMMHNLSMETSSMLEELKSQILSLAGEDFNIDSPKQLGHILFEVLGLPAKKKTKTGYSTNAAILKDLSAIHPLPAMILQYREFAKIKSTYIDALPSIQEDDDLIHTTFHQRKTTTGRLSSSDPNIQNIPTRSEFGNKIRRCFIPLEEDCVFMKADYSQIELRLLAHLSGDKGLIEAFNSGADFHAATASEVFDVPLDSISKDLRSRAKAVNFGIIYGQQAFGLSQQLEIGVKEAQAIIDKYFDTYPQVKKYLDDTVASAYENGYAQTIYGRRRYIPELKDRNRNLRAFGERTAMNHPMQGSAADIIKLAMRCVQDAIYESGLKSRCMMQVHDELDFSVLKQEIEALAKIVKEKMENVCSLKVPLIVDIETGNN